MSRFAALQMRSDARTKNAERLMKPAAELSQLRNTKKGGSIICPACGESGAVCLDSRPLDDGTIRRRRLCRTCSHRWMTVELPLDMLAALEAEGAALMRFLDALRAQGYTITPPEGN